MTERDQVLCHSGGFPGLGYGISSSNDMARLNIIKEHMPQRSFPVANHILLASLGLGKWMIWVERLFRLQK